MGWFGFSSAARLDAVSQRMADPETNGAGMNVKDILKREN